MSTSNDCINECYTNLSNHEDEDGHGGRLVWLGDAVVLPVVVVVDGPKLRRRQFWKERRHKISTLGDEGLFEEGCAPRRLGGISISLPSSGQGRANARTNWGRGGARGD